MRSKRVAARFVRAVFFVRAARISGVGVDLAASFRTPANRKNSAFFRTRSDGRRHRFFDNYAVGRQRLRLWIFGFGADGNVRVDNSVRLVLFRSTFF